MVNFELPSAIQKAFISIIKHLRQRKVFYESSELRPLDLVVWDGGERVGGGRGEAITWSSAIGVFFFSFRRPSSMIKRSTTMTSVKVPEFLMLMAVKTIPILPCADRSGNIFLISSPSGFCLSFLSLFQISRWDIRLSILVFQAFFFCNQRALPLRKIATTENGTLFYPQ